MQREFELISGIGVVTVNDKNVFELTYSGLRRRNRFVGLTGSRGSQRRFQPRLGIARALQIQCPSGWPPIEHCGVLATE